MKKHYVYLKNTFLLEECHKLYSLINIIVEILQQLMLKSETFSISIGMT